MTSSSLSSTRSTTPTQNGKSEITNKEHELIYQIHFTTNVCLVLLYVLMTLALEHLDGQQHLSSWLMLLVTIAHFLGEYKTEFRTTFANALYYGGASLAALFERGIIKYERNTHSFHRLFLVVLVNVVLVAVMLRLRGFKRRNTVGGAFAAAFALLIMFYPVSSIVTQQSMASHNLSADMLCMIISQITGNALFAYSSFRRASSTALQKREFVNCEVAESVARALYAFSIYY